MKRCLALVVILVGSICLTGCVPRRFVFWSPDGKRMIWLWEHGVYLCDARVNLELLNEQLGIELPNDDFDTLGGLVFHLFGKIPVRYEKLSYQNIDFIIQNMEGHKIDTIKIVLQREGTES